LRLVQDFHRGVAVIEFEGQRYTFNLAEIQAPEAVGVDRRLYEATTMLQRLVQMKSKANTTYYKTKLRLDMEYWMKSPEELGLGPKQKQTQTHCNLWMQAQDEYCNLREVRDFIEDTITSLTTAWIPRLRSFSESTNVGERESHGVKPREATTPYPEAPPPPPPVKHSPPPIPPAATGAPVSGWSR
jgi:hypothetical protein